MVRTHTARMRAITRLLRIGATDHLLRVLARLRHIELAGVLRASSPSDRRQLFDLLATHDRLAAMLAVTELDGRAVTDLLTTREPAEIAALLEPLPADDAAHIIGLLPKEVGVRTRAAMREGVGVNSVLEHQPRTAGRIMNPSVFALGERTTVTEAVTALHRFAGTEMVFYVYVIDDRGHLVGVTSLRRLLVVTPTTALADIMTTDVISAHVDTTQDEVARLIASYDLLAIPVLDDEGLLVGVVTVDDAIDVITDATTKEVQRLGGLEALDEPYIATPLHTLVKKRGRWLVLLFLGEMLTATAMSYFEEELSKAVVLAMFVPLVISSGGNSGSQAASLIIRALAVGDVTQSDWWRVLKREVFSGIALGALLGLVGFGRITIWAHMFGAYGSDWIALGVTVACSLIGVVLWGTVAGSMLPFVLKGIGADPATSSAPFVATLVDVSGLVIYFSIASVVLRGTLL